MVTFLFVTAISALIPYVVVPAIQHGVEPAAAVETPARHDGDANAVMPVPVPTATASFAPVPDRP